MESIRSVHFLDWFWGPVLDHLWQSTLFSLLVLVVAALLKRAPARARCALYFAIPIKFLIPSGLVLSAIHSAGVDMSSFFLSMAWATSDPLIFVDRQSSMFHLASGLIADSGQASRSLLSAALPVWIGGTILLAGNWIVRQILLRREIRQGALLRSGREVCLVSRLRRRMNIRRKIRVATSPDFTEIGVFGVWRPVVLLPAEIGRHLSDSEMETILLHEVIHVVRWDNLLSHISMAVCSVFWFHPLVWLADRKLVSEREQVCDDRVIELGSASRIYADSLVKVLKFALGFRVAGVSCAGGPHLKRRIETIASGGPLPRLNTLHRLAVAGVLVILMTASLAAVRMDRCLVEMSMKKPVHRTAKGDCGHRN